MRGYYIEYASMATPIIVVDDDPIVGTLTLELIQEAGFTAILVQDSLKAQDIIKRETPRLVILDILMPGIDGLTLLHRLKSDPATAKIKTIIVSGKSFAAEKDRALQYGAELFIEKPYEVDSFGQKISEIMKTEGVKPKQIAPPRSAPAAMMRSDLKITIWGCRASPSAASPASTRYGKRTSCVSVETPRHLIVFDAGSGIGLLGKELMEGGKFKDVWLFLTHFHQDHIEGLSGLPVARDAAYTLHIAGASDPDKPLEDAIAEAFKPGFGDQPPPCRLEFYELREESYEILPGVRMTAFYSNHPGTALGYSLQAEDRKVVYCPDSEIYGEDATALQDYDEKLGGLCRGADLLFHDGRYTPEDYEANRNSGHSSFIAAVDFAGRNRIKHLVLVHQDDRYSDDELDKMLKDAEARATERGYKLKVSLGREGLNLAV